jgi:hypothetical protein
MALLRMNQAIREALAQMRADPTLTVLAEDVGAAGGVFKAIDGLLEGFGPQRVRETAHFRGGHARVAKNALSKMDHALYLQLYSRARVRHKYKARSWVVSTDRASGRERWS